MKLPKEKPEKYKRITLRQQSSFEVEWLAKQACIELESSLIYRELRIDRMQEPGDRRQQLW